MRTIYIEIDIPDGNLEVANSIFDALVTQIDSPTPETSPVRWIIGDTGHPVKLTLSMGGDAESYTGSEPPMRTWQFNPPGDSSETTPE